MSKKYLEQHSSTGVSNKKVVSKFGMKIMSKLGWSEGEGLGKNKNGITECIQVRKREENLGLGASEYKPVDWANQWWSNSYEQILSAVKIEVGDNNLKVESDDESEDESKASTTSENSEKKPDKKTTKKSNSKSKEEEEESFLHKKRKRTLKSCCVPDKETEQGNMNTQNPESFIWDEKKGKQSISYYMDREEDKDDFLLTKAKNPNLNNNIESINDYNETTYAGTKINDADIVDNAKLELRELEGNILDGKVLTINAAGLLNGSLRNMRDGCSLFGYVKSKDGQIINDFILNMINNLGINISTVFKIFFDKGSRSYYLSPSNSEDESIVFVKLEKLFKITKRHIISLGDIHFSVEVDDNLSLKIELAFGNEETKTKIFNKEFYQVVKIGRNRDNDLVLENYAYSRVHTSFIYDSMEKAWLVQDGYENKQSTNGTWIYLDWNWKIDSDVTFRIGSNFLKVTQLT